MERFTSEGSNEQERGELIRAQSKGEEETPLGHSFESVAGARTLSRRQALGLLGGSLAGFSLLSAGLAHSAKSHHWSTHPPFRDRDHITLECQGNGTGPKFLDGRIQNATVGLAPTTTGIFTGTRWEAVKVLGTLNYFWFFCRAEWPRPAGAPYYEPGNRWLDGRTQEGSVGLAPSRSAPYTGTKWEVIGYGGDSIALKCLGTLKGKRFLDGRVFNGTVGLTSYIETDNNLWKVRILPK